MRGRRWNWQDVLFDVAPPVVLLALGLVDAFTGALTTPIGTAPTVTAVIPGAIACLALLIRRYRPLLSLVIVLLAGVIPPLILPTSLTYWDEFIVWVVALYSCARHLRRSRAFIGLGMSALGMVVLPLEFAELRDLGSMFFNSFLLVVAFSIGLLARSWAEYRDRTIRSAAERAVAEERASHAERARIARELHDVIAHTITVIVMQAGGARLASASDPAIASSTLAQIEELGRASLAELRTLLPLLRDGDEDAPTAPQPTLADVDALCERMRGLGLPITLRVDGDIRGVPLGLQLTGYRSVQEGLTNVIRHSGTVDTTVSIHCSDPAALLTIEVASRPPVDAPRLAGAGRGLAGLEERVGLAGGKFRAGLRPGGDFLLRVELPLKGEPG
jgi:signal transduction histidine kinase